MFDEIFGEKAKASAAVDAYLERMERVLKVKKLAIETGEKSFVKDMNDMLLTLIKLTTIQANDTILAYQKKEEEKK